MKNTDSISRTVNLLVTYSEAYDAAWPRLGYSRDGDAGFDLRATEDAYLLPGDTLLIGTGVRMAVPVGYELQVRPRSGLAAKNSLTVLNSPGTVDSNYRGEIKVILHNAGRDDYMVARGERIAQGVVSEVPRGVFLEVPALDETARGEDGFGSSGRV